MLALPTALVGRSTGQSAPRSVTEKRRPTNNKPEVSAAESSRSTLEYKYQLSGHVLPILACTYNTRRHHIVTVDQETMRLWSLRKELRRVALPKKAKNYLLFCEILYNEEKDQYIGVTSGNPDQPDAWTDAAMVKIYHASLALLLEFQAHKSNICAALFNDERQELITSGGGYNDSVLRVWSIIRPESDEHGVLVNQKGVIGSADGSIDILHRSENILFGASGTDVWLWDLETLDTVRVVQLSGGDINVLCFALESNILHVGTVGGEIVGWDMSSPDPQPQRVLSCQAHNGQVNDLWLEPGSGLFSCGDDGHVYQWDTSAIKKQQHLGGYKFDLSLQTKYHPAAGNLRAIPRRVFVQHIDVPAFHKELLFVIAGGLVTLLEVHAPQRKFAKAHDLVVAMALSRPTEVSSSVPDDGGDPCGNVVVSAPPEIVVLAQNSTLQVVDVRTGAVKRRLEPPCRAAVGALGWRDHQQKRSRGMPGTQLSSGDRSIFSERMTASGGYASSWGGGKGKGLLKPVAPWPDSSLASAEICAFSTMDDAGCYVLGWSDGSVELVESKGGGRALLLEDAKATDPISAMCLLPQLAQGPRSRHALHQSTTSGAAQLIHRAKGPSKQEEFGGRQRKRANSGAEHELQRAQIIGRDHSASRVPKARVKHELRRLDPRVGAGSSHAGSSGVDASVYHPIIGEHLPPTSTLEQRLAGGLVPPLIVAGTTEGTLHVWDVTRPAHARLAASVPAHSEHVVAVQCYKAGAPAAVVPGELVAPGTDVIVSASADCLLKVWTMPPMHLLGFCVLQAPGAGQIPGGRLISTSGAALTTRVSAMYLPAGTGGVVCGFDNGAMQLWQMPWSVASQALARAPIAEQSIHTQKVTKIAATPDGKLLISGGLDHLVVAWDHAGGSIAPVQSWSFAFPVSDVFHFRAKMYVAYEDQVCTVKLALPGLDEEEYEEQQQDEQEPEQEIELISEQQEQQQQQAEVTSSSRGNLNPAEHSSSISSIVVPRVRPGTSGTSSRPGTTSTVDTASSGGLNADLLSPWSDGTAMNLAKQAAAGRDGKAGGGQAVASSSINSSSFTSSSTASSSSRTRPADLAADWVEQVLPAVQVPGRLKVADKVLRLEFGRYDRAGAGRIPAVSLCSVLNACTSHFASVSAGKEGGLGRLLRPTESSRARDVGRPVCTELQVAQMLSAAGVRPTDELTVEDVRVLVNRYIASLAAAGYLPQPQQLVRNAYRNMRPQKMTVTYNDLGERRMQAFDDPNERPEAQVPVVRTVAYKYLPEDCRDKRIKFFDAPPVKSAYLQERAMVRKFRHVYRHTTDRAWWTEDTTKLLPVPAPFRPMWTPGWEKKLEKSAAKREPVMEMVMGRMVEVEVEEETVKMVPPLQLRPLVLLTRSIYEEKAAFDKLADDKNVEHMTLAAVAHRMCVKKYGAKALAEEKLMTLFHSLREHQHHLIVHTFGRALGAFPERPLGAEALAVFMSARMWLVEHQMLASGPAVEGAAEKHDDLEVCWQCVEREHCQQCVMSVFEKQGGGYVAPWLRDQMLLKLSATLPSCGRQEWEAETFEGTVELETFLTELVNTWYEAQARAQQFSATLFPGAEWNPATAALRLLLDQFLLLDPARSGAVTQANFTQVLLKCGPAMWQGEVPCDAQGIEAAWHQPERQVCSEVCQPELAKLALRFRDVVGDGLVCWLDLWALVYVEMFEYGHVLPFASLLERSHEHRPSMEAEQFAALQSYMQAVALSSIAPERKHKWWIKQTETVPGLPKNLDLRTTQVAPQGSLTLGSTQFFSERGKYSHSSKQLHGELSIDQSLGANDMRVLEPTTASARATSHGHAKPLPTRANRALHKSLKHLAPLRPATGSLMPSGEVGKANRSVMEGKGEEGDIEGSASLTAGSSPGSSLVSSIATTMPLSGMSAMSGKGDDGRRLLRNACDPTMSMPCLRPPSSAKSSTAERALPPPKDFAPPAFSHAEVQGASVSLSASRRLSKETFLAPWERSFTPYFDAAAAGTGIDGRSTLRKSMSLDLTNRGMTTTANAKGVSRGTNIYMRFPGEEPHREDRSIRAAYLQKVRHMGGKRIDVAAFFDDDKDAAATSSTHSMRIAIGSADSRGRDRDCAHGRVGSPTVRGFSTSSEARMPSYAPPFVPPLPPSATATLEGDLEVQSKMEQEGLGGAEQEAPVTNEFSFEMEGPMGGDESAPPQAADGEEEFAFEVEADIGGDEAATPQGQEQPNTEVEEKARKQAEGKARKEAEGQARKEAEEKARQEAEKKARKEAEEKARKEAEERARKKAAAAAATSARVAVRAVFQADTVAIAAAEAAAEAAAAALRKALAAAAALQAVKHAVLAAAVATQAAEQAEEAAAEAERVRAAARAAASAAESALVALTAAAAVESALQQAQAALLQACLDAAAEVERKALVALDESVKRAYEAVAQALRDAAVKLAKGVEAAALEALQAALQLAEEAEDMVEAIKAATAVSAAAAAMAVINADAAIAEAEGEIERAIAKAAIKAAEEAKKAAGEAACAAVTTAEEAIVLAGAIAEAQQVAIAAAEAIEDFAADAAEAAEEAEAEAAAAAAAAEEDEEQASEHSREEHSGEEEHTESEHEGDEAGEAAAEEAGGKAGDEAGAEAAKALLSKKKPKLAKIWKKVPKVPFVVGMLRRPGQVTGDIVVNESLEQLGKFDRDSEQSLDELLAQAQVAKMDQAARAAQLSDDEETESEAKNLVQAQEAREQASGLRGKKRRRQSLLDVEFVPVPKSPTKEQKGRRDFKQATHMAFGANIRFKPFTFIKKNGAAVQWDPNDAADSDEENVEEGQKKSHVTFVHSEKDLSFLYQTNDKDPAEEIEQYVPVKLQYELPWGAYFAREEQHLIHAHAVVGENAMEREERLRRERERETQAAMQKSFKRHSAAAPSSGDAEVEQGGGGGGGMVDEETKALGQKWWRHERNVRRAMVASGQTAVEALPFGAVVEGSTEGGQFHYYSVKVDDTDSILTISLSCSEGDADLFVSGVTVPSVVDYDWKSNALGEDRVVIYPDDPHVKPGYYFIGVFAYERRVDYCLVAACSGLEQQDTTSMLHLKKLVKRFDRLGTAMERAAQVNGSAHAPEVDFDERIDEQEEQQEQDKSKGKEERRQSVHIAEDDTVDQDEEMQDAQEQEIQAVRALAAENKKNEEKQAKAARLAELKTGRKSDEGGEKGAGEGEDSDEEAGPGPGFEQLLEVLGAASTGATGSDNVRAMVEEGALDLSDTESVESHVDGDNDAAVLSSTGALVSDYATWQDPALGSRLQGAAWRQQYARDGPAAAGESSFDVRLRLLNDATIDTPPGSPRAHAGAFADTYAGEQAGKQAQASTAALASASMPALLSMVAQQQEKKQQQRKQQQEASASQAMAPVASQPSLTPSTAKFLRAFKSPAPSAYSAASVDKSIQRLVGQRRVAEDTLTRKQRVLEIQKVAAAKTKLPVESINTKPIEKAVASTSQRRIGRAGLRSLTTEPFTVPRMVMERVEQATTEKVKEQTLKSRELSGWKQPVTRAKPKAGPPTGVLKINKRNSRKTKKMRAAKKRQVDPELHTLLRVLDQPHLKDLL